MNEALTILLVEDNLGDIRLIREVFKETGKDYNLVVLTDGEQAVQYMKKEGEFQERQKPHLILLDLNLPKLDGREVLLEFKQDDDWKYIPVIIFSSSDSEKDVIRFYELNANCYVVKPFDFNQYSKVILSLQDFWLNTVRLPQH